MLLKFGLFGKKTPKTIKFELAVTLTLLIHLCNCQNECKASADCAESFPCCPRSESHIGFCCQFVNGTCCRPLREAPPHCCRSDETCSNLFGQRCVSK